VTNKIASRCLFCTCLLLHSIVNPKMTKSCSGPSLKPLKKAKVEPEDDEFMLKKKCSKATLKRTGKLSLLPSLPLDILYEVRNLLFLTWVQLTQKKSPLDIWPPFTRWPPSSSVNEQRFSANLWAAIPCIFSTWLIEVAVMRKNATTAWKAAFACIPELPECPADMSHPAGAHLAFQPICHVRGPHVALFLSNLSETF
jgi:hypothetical protein